MAALAGAVGLHLAVLVVLRFALGESNANFRASSSRSATFWEIELAETTEVATAHEGVREISRRGAMARFVPRANAGHTEMDGVAPETGELTESARGGEPEVNREQGEEHRSPIDLGLGEDGWQRWVTAPKEGVAPRVADVSPRKNRFQVFRPRPASTTGGLQEGLEERDRALGLGPRGRVLSALHAAAHSGVAPEVGVARFEVTVDRTGTVEVSLGAASGHGEQWKRVAASVARDLRSAPPRIPPSRKGFKLVVELVAERTLPNGTKASELEKPHLDVPPLKFQSTEEAVEQTKRENPTTENPTADSLALKLDSPGVYVAESGTVCSYRLGAGAIAPGYRLGAAAGPVIQGACDPSHIGASPQRMVRARVVDQSLF